MYIKKLEQKKKKKHIASVFLDRTSAKKLPLIAKPLLDTEEAAPQI